MTNENKMNIISKYSKEINIIHNRLSDLERGKIYELNHTPGNPSYVTIASDIKNEFDKLLKMIENNEDSARDAFNKYSAKL